VHIAETAPDGRPVSSRALLAFESPWVAEFDKLSHEWRRLGAQGTLEQFVVRVRQPARQEPMRKARRRDNQGALEVRTGRPRLSGRRELPVARAARGLGRCPHRRAARCAIGHWKAKDLLRASGLALLPVDNAHVSSDLQKVDKGEKLSPVLLVRGCLKRSAPLEIADGYHRICASYHLDEDADIPCRMAGDPAS